MTTHYLNEQDKLTLATILVAVNGGDLVTGEGSIPSGYVYARLMGSVDLTQYNMLISVLIDAGMIKKRGNVLSVTTHGAEVAREISAVIRAKESTISVN